MHPEMYISVNTRNLPFYTVWFSSSFTCLLSLCKDFVRHTVVCTHLIQRMSCAVQPRNPVLVYIFKYKLKVSTVIHHKINYNYKIK